jgi:hypothetical protein
MKASLIRRLGHGAILTSLLLACGCMTTRIAFHEDWNADTKPSYVDYEDFYLFGFIGQPRISLQKICVDQKPYGFEKRMSPTDGILSFITLGIYTPITVRVWCGD